MDTSLTPLLAMKSRALFTLLILCTRIFPRSGFGNRSPEKTGGGFYSHPSCPSPKTQAEAVPLWVSSLW